MLTPILSHSPGGADGELGLLDYATLEWKTLPSAGGDAPAMSDHDAVWVANGQVIVASSGEIWVTTLT